MPKSRSLHRRIAATTAAIVAATGFTVAYDVAPAAAVKLPKTLHHSVPATPEAVQPGFPIDYVAVTWEGEHADAEVRFRHQGVWSDWQVVEEDGAAGEGEYGSALVSGNDADAYQVKVPSVAQKAKSIALNTTDGEVVTVSRQPRSVAGAGEPIDYVTRTEWGADESLRFDSSGNEIWPKQYYPVQKLTVHHTATENNDTDPAATVRAIYRYHAVDRGWGDIGYQFLVDESGKVYEGRHTDDDAATAPGFSGTDGVQGAHVAGWNSGNVAVSMLGTLTDQRPTAGAQDGVERALTELATKTGIDPLGSSTYTNPVNGATWTGPNFPGHRDFTSTECPGGVAYELLPTIRERVAARIAGTFVADTTAPVISSISSTVSGTTATVKWNTVGDPSDSQVEYWIRSGSNKTAVDLRFVEAHAASVSGLRKRTTYQYRVISVDAAGNRTASDTYSFKIN